MTSKSPIRNSTGYVYLDVWQIRLAGAVPKLLEESEEDVDEQAGGGTCHTNADGMREDADHSLVRAVRSGAVRERNDGKPEQPTERNATRQPCQATVRQCIAILASGLHASRLRPAPSAVKHQRAE